MSEIDSKFEIAQKELIEEFKKRMADAAETLLSKLYCDITPYAITDSHQNFKNALRDEVKEEFLKEISSEDSPYSWAHSLRMELLKKYPDILRNKIITDLEEKVERLENILQETRNETDT